MRDLDVVFLNKKRREGGKKIISGGPPPLKKGRKSEDFWKSVHKIDPLRNGQKVPISAFLNRSRRVVPEQKKFHEKSRKIKKYLKK